MNNSIHCCFAQGGLSCCVSRNIAVEQCLIFSKNSHRNDLETVIEATFEIAIEAIAITASKQC